MENRKSRSLPKGTYTHVVHPFPPLYDENSKILILGSFPSIKSREQKFFYGHPQNRFWKVIAAVFEAEVPQTIEEKRIFLFKHHIALWDVIASCDIIGSSDSNIRNAEPTNLEIILQTASIRQIYTNGQTAGKMFQKYQREILKRESVTLPSTSPANAAWSLERLTEAWRCIR